MSLFDHPRFHVMRHGPTARNAAGLIAGATDAPLSEPGRHQARAAARALADWPIGRLHASPLLRTWATAQAITALRPRLTIIPAPDLAERDWGQWKGLPRAIQVRDATPPGGEGPAAFHARILRGCAAIRGPASPSMDPDLTEVSLTDPDLADPDRAEMGHAGPSVVAHSDTVRAIGAALRAPFIRPSNCALVSLHRDPRGCWRADPPRIAADPVLQPQRFP